MKWWMRCICNERDGQKQLKPRDLPPKSISLPCRLDLYRPFDVRDVKELEGLLDEIDKALATIRKPTTRTDRDPKVACIVDDAETILDQVSQACQNAQASVSKISNESYKVLCGLLQGVGNLHWAAAGLSMVAFILNRWDQAETNATECLLLLEAMRDLGKHVVALYPQLTEHDERLQRAICLITEGAITCCLHLRCGFFNRFCFASVNTDNFHMLRARITLLYPDITLTVNEIILDRTATLLRQTSMPLSPLKPEYPTNTVGLEERVSSVLQLLGVTNMQQPEPGVQAVVLHGMGGIGKSTLGMALHAKLPFTGRAHAKVEVGESPTCDKIRDCQRDILERLSGRRMSFGSCSEGRQKLGSYFEDCTTPLLLFIDNIFKWEDIDQLLPDRLILPDGSRILVTSRDASVCAVLDEKGVPCQAYPVAELGLAQARELLCVRIFEGFPTPPNREGQVSDLLNICGGLPLALEVVGCYLRRHRTDKAWSSAIKSLQECRPVSGKQEDTLYQSLMFSFNQLAEDYQTAFLDITCLFADLPWDWVEPIYGEKLVILQELALVKKMDEGDGCVRLQVHDLLVALGRRLQPGTRIWSDGQDELPLVLQEDDTANCGIIEGIFVRNCSEPIHTEKLDMVHRSLRILILQDVEVLGKCYKHPRGLQLFITKNGVPYKDLSQLNELEVLVMAHESDFDFENMEFPRHLKVLILVEVRKLKYLPPAFGDLSSLHTLEISWCQTVQELPETFWRLRSLRTLVLTCFEKLKELPIYFERLQSLQVLDLRYCEQLQKLPDQFGQLIALQRLDLCGCKSLKKLPDDFSQLRSLEILHLGECESLEALPENFGNLICLQDLNLTRCKSLQQLPDGFEMLCSLQTLSLEHCHKLATLSPHFGRLSSLITLRLSDCPHLVELPESFLLLRQLRSLDVSGCKFSNMDLLGELKQCRVVCEDINLEDLPDFESPYDESAESIYFGSIDEDEDHDFDYYGSTDQEVDM